MLLPLAAAILLPACVTIRSVEDGIARARFGENVRAGPVVVSPTRLIEDSRCPAKVQCIRAGTVQIAVKMDGRPTELALNQPVAAAGGSLTLVEVYPERREGETLYPDQYRFGFRWNRPK